MTPREPARKDRVDDRHEAAQASGRRTCPAETERAGIPAEECVAALADENASLRAKIAGLERNGCEVAALTALAAHELMQPLIHADACVDLLAEHLAAPGETAMAELLDRRLREFRASAERARRFAETLLRDAQVTGRPLERRPVDTARLAAESADLLHSQIVTRRVAVHIGALPEIRGDAVLLGGVFMNLFTNALKYGARDGGEIRLDAERLTDAWQFTFASTGRAITPEEQERIFEPFVRGAAERRAYGAGIGLALCRRVVERHGGQMRVSPRPGWGNVFVFTLPD